MSNLETTAKATGGTSFDTAKCTGGRKIHPFDKNDLPNSGVIYEHTMTQAKTEYQPLALDLPMTGTNKPTGSPFADDATAFSVGDSEPNDAGNGLVTFTRTFSQVPDTYTDQIGLISRATPQIESPSFSPRDYQYNAWYTEDEYADTEYTNPPFRSCCFQELSTTEYQPTWRYGSRIHSKSVEDGIQHDDFFKFVWFNRTTSSETCSIPAYQYNDIEKAINERYTNTTSDCPSGFDLRSHAFGSYLDFSYLSNARYKVYAENKSTWDSVGDDVSGLTPVINVAWSNYTASQSSSSFYNRTITNTIANTNDLQLRVVVTADKLEGVTDRSFTFSNPYQNTPSQTTGAGKRCTPYNFNTAYDPNTFPLTTGNYPYATMYRDASSLTVKLRDTDFTDIDGGVGIGSICQIREGRNKPVGTVIKYQSPVDNKYNMVSIGGLTSLRLIAFGGGKLEAISEPSSIYKTLYNANTSSTSQSLTTQIAFGNIIVDGTKAFTDTLRFDKGDFSNLGIEFGGTGSTNTEPEINVPAEATYTFIKTDQPENISLESKLLVPTTLTNFTNPTISEYLALTTSKQKIQAENEFIERYMGNIYKKTSIKSPIV